MSRDIFYSYMDCHDFVSQVDTFIDGELDNAEHSAMEAHSRVCGECNDKEARRRDTRQRLRQTSEQYRPSTDFMARLRTSLDEKTIGREEISCPSIILHDGPGAAAATAGSTNAPPVATVTERRPLLELATLLRRQPLWLGVAAAGLLALGVGLSMAARTNETPSESAMVAGVASFASPVIGESVAWHRRTVPVEVVGPDPSSVREWFSDKVSFAVSVPDFGRSARLLGGRLSHVRHYEAAYLLYEANGGKLSVMLFDAGDSGLGLDLENDTFVDNSNGYNVAIRERAGVTYTFTSDMDVDVLAELVDGVMQR